MKELIQRRLVFVEAEQTMTEVVCIMRDQNISSVLVLNQDRLVAGIVTERDIVQKFTLLENQEKMVAHVAAFMTRPVNFARLAYLENDVRDMFFQNRLRHFPVSDGSHHEKDILGMLTVTDLTRAYLRSPKMIKNEEKEESLVIIAGEEVARARYKTLFESLKFITITGPETNKLMKMAFDANHPIVFDIDGLPLDEAKRDLTLLRAHKGVFIILSSQPALVEPLRKMLSSEQHFVALKPLDISYILMLLSRLHETAEAS